MRDIRKIALSKSSLNRLEAMPVPRSTSINNAIHRVIKNPDVIAQALHLRLYAPIEQQEERITYSRDPSLEKDLKNLSNLCRLPADEVIRLSVEAYLNRL